MPVDLPLNRYLLSPTDFSQQLRLGRCERYLRLRMVEREHGRGFLTEAGAYPQEPSALLSEDGDDFEGQIIAALRETRTVLPSIDAARSALSPGQSALIFQPRLEARLGRWNIRGDADIIELFCDAKGVLSAHIIDVKSSEGARVEHRLQVAFYAALLEAVHGIPAPRLAILHRGESTDGWPATLATVTDPAAYRAEVDALVQGEHALADRLADAPFENLFFALESKCDGCRYGELCQKTAREEKDLSIVPYLSARDKRALLSAGIRSAEALANLKDLDGEALTTPQASIETVRRLASTSAGPRLDELILRARRAVELPTLTTIPGLGHSTLPHTSPELHPNLVTVFLDLQSDPGLKRAYLAASRVITYEEGAPVRSENIVELLERPPATDDDERALLTRWTARTLEAVARLAAPDADGNLKVPLHLVFFDPAGESALLDTLARHLEALTETTPALYDLLTQPAAYDSPSISFLTNEIRERRNWPLLCPSLHNVASYLKFDWGELKEQFKAGVFDGGPNRPRHSSRLPGEYSRATLGTLPANDARFDPFRGVSRADLLAFAAKRMEAMAHVADALPKNERASKTPFDLAKLLTPEPRAHTLADALAEFLTLERHTFLTGWRDARQLAPERRALRGETLLVRYSPEDNTPETVEALAECMRRKPLQDAWRAENPGKRLTGALKEELGWSLDGLSITLRLDLTEVDAEFPSLLGLLDLKEGDSVVLSPRWSVDERLPEEERVPFTPTPKQLLYATRARLERVPTIENPTVSLTFDRGFGSLAGFTFGAMARPLAADTLYTLDPSPDDLFGYWHHKVIEALKALEANGETNKHSLYAWLRGSAQSDACERAGGTLAGSLPPPPVPATPGQGKGEELQLGLFSESPVPLQAEIDGGVSEAHGGTSETTPGSLLLGLEAFHAAGHFHDFEESKRAYIGGHFDEKILLVQGPPGTGKSYASAFAILARLQDALEHGVPCRVFLSCKTHSATDVLLREVSEAIETLTRLRQKDSVLWEAHFRPELLEIPLIRLERGQGSEAQERIRGERYAVVAGTPGGVYRLVKDAGLTGTNLCDWLVLDEASQMSLPEALMAALPLTPQGKLIVVGDPRQMPPIVQRDWSQERGRTFQTHPVYRSLYETLSERGVPTIAFSESFRLHKTLARFLRDEIYIHDGIDYRSRRTSTLTPKMLFDPLAAAALAPDCPLVVIVHGESASQTRNLTEEQLLGPILTALIEEHQLDGKTGFGVVVPHRAQRAGLRAAYPFLEGGVDTVERYQGDERDAILISAVESDPEFLQASAAFLLDPRRLNVALSRAKKKLILVAARTIFDLLPTDDALFTHAQFWKNLLRRACPEKLWEGDWEGTPITVWGGKSE
ncbi:MAG: AAA domain-containing protein [Armatimonas sp.]